MAITLDDDDTFSGSVVMAFSDELAKSMGSDPQELWDQMGTEMESDLPEGATQEPYAEDGYTGTRITYSDMPVSELDTGAADSLSVVREGDDYVVSGTMDMTGEEFQPESGDATSDELTRQMMESLDIRISITFPGEVAETNGEVDGTTVTWRPVVGEVNDMSARGSAVAGGAATSDDETGSDDTTDDGTSGTTDGGQGTTDRSSSGVPAWLWFIIGGVVLLAIIGVVLWLVLRSKPTPQDGQTAGFQQGGYPGQPGQYPGQPQGQQYPGQPGQYPAQGQPGQYPGQPYPAQPQGQPGQYPGQPQGQPYPGQPYPGQQQPQQHPGQPGGPQAYGAQPPAPGQYGAQPPAPPHQQGGYPGAPAQFAPPAATQPLPPTPGAHPQPSQTTPYPPAPPAATRPPAPYQQPAPTQPLPPQPGAPGQSDPDDEIDDATRLRPPTE